MYHAQFPDRQMPHHRIFQLLLRQLREPRLFYVTKHDACRRRAVPSPSMEESILNLVADGPESNTRPHHVSVSHQTVCRFLYKRKSLTPLPFSASTALNPGDYLSYCQWVVQQCALQLDF
ncbi:hypothetical protein TNCV_871891 [Trichonephila clavipes]|nr:hypothetical protein TNCV_871891 [Trichonephila clavipes]